MITKPKIVVAYDKNRVIGLNGEIPWQSELPSDLRHFKDLTVNNIVVMGRKTYESIGKPLPSRENRILSRATNRGILGCSLYAETESALEIPESDSRTVFIIGGADIYEAYLPRADTIYATEIDFEFVGDTFFPGLDSNIWSEILREKHQASALDFYNYDFVTYERTK